MAAEFVVSSYRAIRCLPNNTSNGRDWFLRIFRAMRSTRYTESEEDFPSYVCAWTGHSEEALLRVTAITWA